jgi:uncharacterized protein YegL
MSHPRYQPYVPPYNPHSQTILPTAPPPPPYQHSQQSADIHPPVKGAHSDSDASDDEHDEHDEHDEMHAHCVVARHALLDYGIPSNHRAQICIALDVSGSMEAKNVFYSSGKIQKLIEKMMAIAIELSAGEKHSVTIFPFGKVAYDPIVSDEHDIAEAVLRVFNAIGKKYSDKTNYNAVVKKIRTHYFGDCRPLNAAKKSDKEPVLTFFVTDGDDNLEQNDARSQFLYAEYNAIFFKFIALKGMGTNHQFPTLISICNPGKNTFLENKNLLILNDPSELTIPLLLDAYRPWLEEAHEHEVLLHDPGVKLNPENVHDRADIARQLRFEDEHGHDELSGRHGHVEVGPLLNQHGTFKSAQQHQSIVARRVLRQYPREEECCKCTLM